MKALALDKLPGYGSVRPHYKQKDGRKQCQRLIYKSIITGILSEVSTGTSDRPGITITTGGKHLDLLDGNYSVYLD